METIRYEASILSKLEANIDNLREKFIDKDYNYEISVTCPSFDVLAYNENLFRLLAESKYVPFKSHWDKRPDYVSYDFYKSTLYWPVILFVNFCDDIEGFTGFEKILVPKHLVLTDIIRTRKRISKEPFDITKDIIFRREKGSSRKLYQQHPLGKEQMEEMNLKYIRDENERVLKSLKYHLLSENQQENPLLF